MEVTGRSQSEVAALLREIPIGGAATLAVSRQDQRNGDAASGTADSTPETEKPASPKLPRQLVSGLGFRSSRSRLALRALLFFCPF